MRSVTIRPATAADDDEIARITVDAYVDGGHLPSRDHRYAGELRKTSDRRERAELLVAEVAGEIAGTVTFVRGGTEYSEFGNPGDAEIRMLAVDPAHAGRGVGAALVDAVLDRARAIGADGIALYTLDSMHSARRIYQRLGFARLPELDHEVPGAMLRAYRLDLAGAATG